MEIGLLEGIAALPARWRRAASGLRESARHAAADAMEDCASELDRTIARNAIHTVDCCPTFPDKCVVHE